MFDSHFRTLFLSTPVHLSHRNGHLMIGREDGTKVSIPLADILCVICESPQITLSASLLDCFASEKIVLFTCDQSHLPSGILTPLVGHYKALSIVQAQSALSKQKKAILWQKIIKQKLYNQALLLECVQKIKESQKILQLYKQVRLNDTSNHEAQAAALYFPALFFKGFRRNGMQEKKHQYSIELWLCDYSRYDCT